MREVPSIPAGLEPKLRNVLSAVRESLNAAIKNINLNTESLAGMTQWIQPALDSSTDLVTFNESLIQSTLESATGADGAAGINARAVTLTTPDQAFTYDSNGANPSPINSAITATIINTLGVVYYEFFLNDVSTGTATTSNVYTYTPQASFGSMPDKLEVQIREDSITGPIEARDMMTMIGLRAGAHGITVGLSNEAHTLPKTIANVVTYTGSGTKINVWEGATALTEDSSSPYANSTFRVTATGTSITPGAVTGTGTATLTYGDSSAMTTDPAKIIFTIIAKRADGTEITIPRQQSLSFSQQGATGSPGSAGGDSIDIVFVRSATQPATPTASPGTPTAPITWYTDVASVPASANPLWASTGFKASASANYIWDLPIRIEGASVAEVTVFTRGVPTSTPTGGTYTFSTPPVLTVPTSTGATWTTYIPSGSDAVYTSRAVVSTAAGNTSAVAITGWTTPVISFQNGADAVLSDLSNDNHTVPTDSSGSNGNFTGCATTMSVFIGSADDSANWTYAVTKSAGVTCTDTTSRTQAVTAMTTDTGTVTIVASKAGFASQTQVFSISKAKSGVAYSINLSNNSVRKSALGALSPASLTLTASKIDIAGVTAYTGRFKIYLNGSGTAAYTSATDEASHPYTVTGTDTTIKCELYLAGGTTTLVDTETVLVVADGTNGDPGDSGDSVDIIFKRGVDATTAPTITSPSTNGGTGWTTTVPAAGQFPLWSSTGFQTASTGNYTWQAPVKIEGANVAEVTIYTRSVPTTTPTGGTYTFGSASPLTTSAITATGALAGTWSASVPFGTLPVYTSRAVVSAAAGYSSAVSITGWTTPVISFQNGSIGPDGARATFTTYATYATAAAWNDAAANAAIIAMTGSGGVIVVGDEVTICYPSVAAATYVLTKYASAVGSPATTATWTVRGQVIDGNLMVTGTLSAASLKTSNLTAANAISVVNTSNVTRIKMGNLGSSYGLQGWNNSNTSVFKLDENGLDSKITQNALNLFGCSYHNRIIFEGNHVFTILGTAVQTVVLPMPISTAGIFRLKAQITGYWENDIMNTSHALWREMSMGVYFRNSTQTTISMGVVSESSDTTDSVNFPATKVTLQVNATTEQPELKLVSRAGTAGTYNYTYYSYIIWAIDNVAYPYGTY